MSLPENRMHQPGYCYLCDSVPCHCKTDGGYCPKCDTDWAAPGKCRCIVGNPEQIMADEMSI